MKKILIAIYFISQSACDLVMTHSINEQSIYYRQTSSSRDFYLDQSNHMKSQAKEELGFRGKTLLLENDTAKLNNRLQLNAMEKQLNSDSERQQYYQLKPYFQTDQQRISFLNLPGFEAKQRWIQSKAWLLEKNAKPPAAITKLIDENDIGLNMSRQAVRESWGPPDFVESAGNSMYGNERWVYRKMQSTTEGYINETRVVYFESARVAGWDKY